jgi:hypothetical protein
VSNRGTIRWANHMESICTDLFTVRGGRSSAHQKSHAVDIQQTTHLRNPASEPIAMIRPIIVISSIFASYFVMIWLFLGYWGQALMVGWLATLVFSTTLFAASFVARGRPWRAFWIANAVLILVFGGLELHGLLTIRDNHATRFGGARLSVDGYITATGYASLVFDIALCTLSNFLGFYLSQFLIRRVE